MFKVRYFFFFIKNQFGEIDNYIVGRKNISRDLQEFISSYEVKDSLIYSILYIFLI